MIYNQNAIHARRRPYRRLRAALIIQLFMRMDQLKAYWQNLSRPELITSSQLSKYPSGTLGQDLSTQIVKAVKKEDLNALLFELLFPNFRNDKRMPFVLFGNGKRNKSILIKCACLWITFYEKRGSFSKAYNYGKSLNNFTSWDLTYLFNEPTALLKAMILKESVGVSEAPIMW